MANAWLIVGTSDETDNTVDVVLNTDNSTFTVAAADVPNPAWVDDGSQTTPDTNGQDRFLAQDADAYNNAQIFGFGDFTIGQVRTQKAFFQELNPQYDVQIITATVDVTPDAIV
ncbi:hypothetical protein Lepto7376_3134 [[Leptolyngbya] sp. PCC 7376]|uniref:hypothetical protein n=1 Tax=[Leptolyngbya] sp. PCC 7376 TaxID=111781 RepID=UPI00029F1091|nr:hypothetical protein [[Leptolyngbya] sp. PCC 7376]AFY39371.1 hypothetical protein Lepto7376_3134 [[Leptolyngbya] sp. PCC 7376]